MWKLIGFDGQPLECWERRETEKSVPYYMNHKSQKTQWTHPLLHQIMVDLVKCNEIKYAAYRTAMKARALQKKLQLHLVDLPTIFATFEQRGYRTLQNDYIIDSMELDVLLGDLFFLVKKNEPSLTNLELYSELLLNLLLNLYDPKRVGGITVQSAKVALIVLCNARLRDKYRFLFYQVVDYNNCLSRQKMSSLLQDIAKIPEELSEKLPFGVHLVPAAVDSCFQRSASNMGVSEEIFLDWLMAEPQTLVWLSTLYRLSSAEAVKHDTRCSVCKVFPILGFRYKCLKCFNYDLCQNCFFVGRTSKNHKTKHPTHEYCNPITPKEDTKAFMQTIRNNLSKKHRRQSKQCYLPIEAAAELCDGVDQVPNHIPLPKHEFVVQPPDWKTMNHVQQPSEAVWNKAPEVPQIQQAVLQSTQKRDLESIVYHLDEENKGLHHELHDFNSVTDSATVSSPTHLREKQHNLLAKQEILQDHNRQLEIQLQRLRVLLKDQLDITISNYSPGVQSEEYDCTPLPPPAIPPKSKVASTPAFGYSTFSFKNVSPIDAQQVIEEPLLFSLQDSALRELSPPKSILDTLHSKSYQKINSHRNGLINKHDNLSVSDTLCQMNDPLGHTEHHYNTQPILQSNNQIQTIYNSPNVSNNIHSPSHQPKFQTFHPVQYNSLPAQRASIRSSVRQDQVPHSVEAPRLVDYAEVVSRPRSRSSNHSYSTIQDPPSSYHFTLTDLDQYSIDSRVSDSHYSLPIPNQSYFPEEESELDEIIQKLEQMFPVNNNHIDDTNSGHNSMLLAAHSVGNALSTFVGHVARTDSGM